MQDNDTNNIQNFDFKNTCLLVSDSNEVGNQFDSNKLEYPILVQMVQDNLFKKFLDMSKYLTRNQFNVYSEMLNNRFNELSSMEQALQPQPGETYKPPFKVVDGQVILIEVDALARFNESSDIKYSPQEYIKKFWNITSEYQLLPIPNCMLRGLSVLNNTKLNEMNNLVPEKPQNETVRLTEDNIPPHMHHSSITGGANFTTITGNTKSPSYFVKGSTTYDMFYNDSICAGLSKNELDGSVDTFTIDEFGRNDSSEEQKKSLLHNNMPKYHAFYGFVVQKQ